MNGQYSSHEVDVAAGHESKANISAPHICGFSLYFQIKPCVVNESACFAFLNWPGTKEAWGAAGESGLWGGFFGLAEFSRKCLFRLGRLAKGSVNQTGGYEMNVMV